MANEAKQFTINGVTHDVMDVGARQLIADLQTAINAITSGDTTTAIKTFQEVIDFLDGVTDDTTLIGKLNELRALISAKYSKPASGIPASDLADGVIPDTSGFATKNEVALKANSVDVYTKAEVDDKVADAGKVKSVSVNGGTPAQPDMNGNVNLPNISTKDYVDDAVDDKLTQVVVNEITGAADIITIDDADLAFIDEDGNIAMQVTDGHVETQKFDSRQVATNTTAIQQLRSQISQQGSVQTDVVVKEDSDAAFDIADESGKVALRITSKGHIKTKGFDSENIDMFRTITMGSPKCACHGYGAVSGYVSNTIPYFRQGYANGYRYYEVDAVRCSDGVPVCTHFSSSKNVYDKTTGELRTINMSSVDGLNTIDMTSDELVSGYTWDAEGNAPISLLRDVVWQICYFYRCPLHIHGQALSEAESRAISQYAESLGVGQYVFHVLFTKGYSWDIPCNIVINAVSVENIQLNALRYKKNDNNIMFTCDTDVINGNTDEALSLLATKAHESGCYIMANATLVNIDKIRSLFRCGFDVCLTNGITNTAI